jgi:hypothetical protein
MKFRFKTFKKHEVEGKEVVSIVLFRKLGTKYLREMPMFLNEEGEKVFGQTWRGYWWRICDYPVRWNFSTR